jgi:hypothetical protein
VVDGFDATNLTKLLIQNLMARGKLIKKKPLFLKLFCSGVDGVLVF